jgi:hypothetical protein
MMIMRYLLLILISISLQAAEPLFFIQMADPQLGMFGKNENSIQEEANLSFVVANINRLKPTFVVVCGDLVNKTGDSEQIRSYKQIIKNVEKDIPVYNVPGNHDVGNQPAREQLARYREAFGKDYYTFDAGPLRGIVLNSSLIGSPQNAPEEAAAQEKWLLSELARARRDRIENLVVFQHLVLLERSHGARPILQHSAGNAAPLSSVVSRVRRKAHIRRALPPQRIRT